MKYAKFGDLRPSFMSLLRFVICGFSIRSSVVEEIEYVRSPVEVKIEVER